jgi:MFS transporter, SET family, sugar efflux transporter
MNLPLLLTKELGGDESHVGIAFAIGPIAEMPLMLWFGRLAARGHQVTVIRFGVLIGVVYFLALMFVEAPLHVYPLQLLNAAAIAVTMSVAIPYFQDLLPGQTGVATSIYTSSYSLGCLLGYFSFGVLVSSLGHRGIVLICAGLGALSFGVLMIFQRRREAAGA